MPGTLIVRLPNWLGDTVMAVPVLRALRAAAPARQLVAAGPWAALLEGQGCADVLVRYPRGWWGRGRATPALRALRPETAVLLPGSLESAVAARLWGARRRIGLATRERAWLLTDPVPVPSPRPHQIDEYLLALGPLGVPATDRTPRLLPPPRGSAARRAARGLLEQSGVTPGADGPRVGVHLGAAFGPAKTWPAHHVAGFCRLARAAGLLPVLLGTGDEAARARAVLAAAPAASLVGRDRPDILPAVLAELDALVAADTGVAHLAAALGVPVVTLFGPTDPALTAPRGPVAVLRRPVDCAPCFRRVCPIDHRCMEGLAPAEVVATIGRLLAEPGKAGASPR
jgi:heptosyltransferase II